MRAVCCLVHTLKKMESILSNWPECFLSEALSRVSGHGPSGEEQESVCEGLGITSDVQKMPKPGPKGWKVTGKLC